MSGYAVAQRAPIAGVTSRRRSPGKLSARSAVVGPTHSLKQKPISNDRFSFPRRARGGGGVCSAALQDGQLVTIHYVMKFPDGEVGDDTRKRNAPATLPIGQGQLFPALEAGIKEMEEGETKTFEIACADAYGKYDDAKVQKLPATGEELEALKQQIQPGQAVQLPNDDGIVLDNNHPLADKDLTFEITLVGVANGPELFGVPIVPLDVNKLMQQM